MANLAQAALDYATVAKAYFKGGKISNAIKARLERQDAAILAETSHMKVYDEVGTPYTFGAASLQLEDTVNFVFAITATGSADVSELANGYYIRLWDEEANEFGATYTAEFEPTYIGKQAMVAIIKGVPESEFSKTQTFALCDDEGVVYSVLEYSVKDYCVRTLSKAAEAEKNMIRALYAIASAATDYLA